MVDWTADFCLFFNFFMKINEDFGIHSRTKISCKEMFQNIVYYFVRNYIYILSIYVPSLFNVKEKLSDFGLQFISICDV